MKICLINPPVQMNRRLWYPIGICYVASSLIKAGFEVEIIDIIGENLSRKDFKKRLSSIDAKYFGVGGLVTAFNNVLDIVDMVREEYPNSFIFAGNTVGYTIPEILLQNSTVNAIIMGEGEITTVELINTIENEGKLEDVMGITFKNHMKNIIFTPPRPPIENLDDLPFPAWDLIPMKNYFENVGRNVYPISSVRGCPYNCIFCCKTFIGYKVRSRSPKCVMDELLEVKKLFNIDTFEFFDDLFMYNKKRFLEFCDLKINSPLKDMRWVCSARVNSLDEEVCEALTKSHCYELGIGFESASQEILDYYNKKITVEQSQNAINLCTKYGISLGGASFMIGAPNETEDTIRTSADFAKKNGLRYTPHFATPFPKTPMYDYAIQKGLIKDEFEYMKTISKFGATNHLIINLTDNFTNKELVALRMKYQYYPSTPLKHIKYYTQRELEIIKHEGILKCIIKTIKHSPQVLEKMLSPIKPPKREKYSNEWN